MELCSPFPFEGFNPEASLINGAQMVPHRPPSIMGLPLC